MQGSSDEAMKSVKARIDKVADEVEQSVHQVADINSKLISVSANLTRFSTTISETEAV